MPPTEIKASSIEIYQTLAVPNVWLADKYATHVIGTKRGDVVVGAAPYPLRLRVLEGVDTAGKTIAERVDYLLNQPPIQFVGVTYYGGALRTCPVSHLTNFVKLAVSPLSAAMAQ